MINIIIWVASLFSPTQKHEKPIYVPQEIECGLSQSELEQIIGEPDNVESCYGDWSALRYRDKYYVLVEGALVGEIPLKNFYSKCTDHRLVNNFKSICEVN